MLPLNTPVVDEDGNRGLLKGYFRDVPVVLVLGYYRCRTACTTLMESVLVALSASGLRPSDYRIVEIGIDPRETPTDARAKADAYRRAFGDLPVRLLTADEDASRGVAAAAGVRYTFDSRYGEYSHPLGFIVAAPDGTISRYFPGLGFDPQAVRLAVVEASQARLGSIVDQMFLRCAHFDPATGRYTFAAVSAVRAICLAVALLLGVWMWRRRRGAPA